MIGHTLIAGVTGSGKSYAEHKLIEKALDSGAEVVLLDPKMVELREYAKHPGVIQYTCDIDDIAFALDDQTYYMEDRYNAMIANGDKQYVGKDRYIFLDETADLMILKKQLSVKALNRLSMLGRAARMWLVLCTQRATADIIPRSIIINLDNIVCLRQAKSIDSNQLIGRSGAEKLPRIGYAFLKTPDLPTALRFRTDDVIDMLWKENG